MTDFTVTHTSEFRIDGATVPVCFIDRHCPTIRNAPGWRDITPYNLWRKVRTRRPQKILLASTSPAKLMLVYETYPRWDIEYLLIMMESFLVFTGLVSEANKFVEIQPSGVDWKKEGF